jgi:hypothetical protein
VARSGWLGPFRNLQGLAQPETSHTIWSKKLAGCSVAIMHSQGKTFT